MAGLPGQLLGELLGPLELFGADQFQDQFEYVPVVEPDFPRTRGCPVLVPDLLPGLASPALLFSDVMKLTARILGVCSLTCRCLEID